MTRALSRQLCVRAETLMAVGRHDDALELLGEASAADPSDARPFCLRANCHLSLGRGWLAVEAARGALALEPSNAWALRMTALGWRMVPGRSLDALDAAARSLELEPNEPAAHRVHALALSDDGRNRDAEQAAARALELNPNDPESMKTAGLVALHSGKLRLARRWFRSELRVAPGSWTAHNNLGVISVRRGNDIGAARHFLRSIRVQPLQTPIANLHGTVDRALGSMLNVIAVLAAGLVYQMTARHHLAVVLGCALFDGLLVAAAFRFRSGAPRALMTVVRESIDRSLRSTGILALLATDRRAQDSRRQRWSADARLLGAATFVVAVTAGFWPPSVGKPIAFVSFLLTAPIAGALVGGSYVAGPILGLFARTSRSVR